MAKFIVSSDQMDGIVGKCLEVQRIARLDGGCPWDPDAINKALQAVVEGKFPGAQGASQPAPPASLLEEVAKTKTSPRKVFKAADFFKEENQPNGIRFWLGDNFKNHVLKLNGTGKIELDVPAGDLTIYRLRKNSVDKPILAELGGEETVEEFLAYMAELIEKQAKGEQGILLTNGYANIFYIKDDNGTLWAVFCYWYSGCSEWRVEADPITDPDGVGADVQVFSRAIL